MSYPTSHSRIHVKNVGKFRRKITYLSSHQNVFNEGNAFEVISSFNRANRGKYVRGITESQVGLPYASAGW